MEFWEITSKRAQQTLAVWSRHASGMRIGTQGVTEMRQMIARFAPQLQARAAAHSAYWEAFYHGQAALRDLKQLALKLTRLLEGHLDDDTPLMLSLQAVYRVAPRTEATILGRLRALLPIWEGLNAQRAAFSPPEPPIHVIRQGRGLDLAAVHGLLAAYAHQVETIQEKAALLKQARTALRTHDRATDRLSKRWYRVAKASAEDGSALATALHGIRTTLPSQSSAPDPRASVVECGGKPWRDTAVVCRRASYGPRAFFPRSTAVWPGQAAPCPLPPHSDDAAAPSGGAPDPRGSVVECVWQALARHRCRVSDGVLRPQIVKASWRS